MPRGVMRTRGLGASGAMAAAALLLASLLIASLLGASTALAQSPSEAASPAPSSEPLPTTAPTFPLTLTDDEGTSIALPAEPQRIVSLSPSNTEIVFALGAGDRLVGGTDADDYPAEAAALPDAVVQTKVQKEQIVSLSPDLILANGNGLTPQADIDQLRQLGFPVMVLTASSLDGVERDIDLIGEAIGEFDTATSTVTTMQSQVQEVENAVADVATTPRTFYEVGYGPDIYTPPADSAYADLIRLAGGDPVSGDESYVIPLEKLVQADPQVILLGDAAYGTCPERRRSPPGLAGHECGQGRRRATRKRPCRHPARAAHAARPRLAGSGQSIRRSRCPTSRRSRRSAGRRDLQRHRAARRREHPRRHGADRAPCRSPRRATATAGCTLRAGVRPARRCPARLDHASAASACRRVTRSRSCSIGSSAGPR